MGYTPKRFTASTMARKISGRTPLWMLLDEANTCPPPGEAARMISFTASSTSAGVPKVSRWAQSMLPSSVTRSP